MKWDFVAKLNTTILMPFFVIALVQAYRQIAMRIMLRSAASLRQQLLTVHCALFSLGTVNYLKTILAVWDCSINSDNLFYLDAQPSIECTLDNAEYSHVVLVSLFGTTVYLFTLSVILKGIFGIRIVTNLQTCRDQAAGRRKRKKGERVRLKGAKRCLGGLLIFDMEKGRQQFAFFASKVRSDWYWWELVVLARKSLLVMIALFNTRDIERGWFIMSNLQVFAIVAHLMVQPYRQRLTNMCTHEFFAMFVATAAKRRLALLLVLLVLLVRLFPCAHRLTLRARRRRVFLLIFGVHRLSELHGFYIRRPRSYSTNG
jgi:hypothetical protein